MVNHTLTGGNVLQWLFQVLNQTKSHCKNSRKSDTLSLNSHFLGHQFHQCLVATCFEIKEIWRHILEAPTHTIYRNFPTIHTFCRVVVSMRKIFMTMHSKTILTCFLVIPDSKWLQITNSFLSRTVC